MVATSLVMVATSLVMVATSLVMVATSLVRKYVVGRFYLSDMGRC